MGVRTHPIYSNFSAGEVTPRMAGRVDWDKWQAGCVTLENFLILPQGGVVGRPGTLFINEVKDSTKATRLIPFRVSDTDNYVLEMGDGYVRFYKNRARLAVGAVPVEVVSPFLAADLFRVHYTPVENTLVFANQGYAQRRLSRYSDTSWRMATMQFDPPPSREHGTRTTSTVGGTLTPAAVTGTNVQLDSSAAIFLAADVDREIIVTSNGSRATITVVDSTTRVHADIGDDFPDLTAVPAGDWKIDGSPMATVTPDQAGPIGRYIILPLTDALGAPIAGWRIGDVGKYVLMSGGVVRVETVPLDTQATGKIIAELDGTTAQPAGAWSLEEASWSVVNGYPSTVGWIENRLAFGGSLVEKDTIWASASFAPLDFALGSTDDAAIIIRAGMGDESTIRWFSPRRKVLMGSASDEWVITAPSDAALTPANVKPQAATPHGSNFIRPVRSEHATLFVTGNGRILRELAYSYDIDDYRAPDLLAIAEHLTQTYPIVALAYQRPPESIVWAPRSDGVLPGLTYLRDQDIVGWHRLVTDGVVEDACCIPSTDGTTEEVWLLVKRTIGGVAKRYIEVMDRESTFHSATVRGLRTDSCVLQTDAVATTTVTGLGHLEGETVAIVGDGSVYPNAVVTGGQVTLNGPAALKKEVGLPFTCTLVPNRPEVPVSGTSQGLKKSWGEITVRLKDTQGCVINGERVPWRSAADPMGVAPPSFTGDKKVNNLGWDTDAFVTIVQDKPCHIEVLAITGTILIGD